MTRSIFATILVAVFLLLAPRAEAQCPPGITNPLQILTTSYAFKVFPGQLVPTTNLQPDTGFYYSAGRFRGSIGKDTNGNPRGVLSITASSNSGVRGITRQEADAGSYTILPDCSGGTLIFNLSTRPAQFDFWFGDGFKALFGVSVFSFPGVLEGGIDLCGQCFNNCTSATGLDNNTCRNTPASCAMVIPLLSSSALTQCQMNNCTLFCKNQ